MWWDLRLDAHDIVTDLPASFGFPDRYHNFLFTAAIQLAFGRGGKDTDLGTGLMVYDPSTPGRDGGAPHDSNPLNPWEIPDPKAVQGLDCKTACAAAPTSPPAADSGGCSVATRARTPVWGALALIGSLCLGGIGRCMRRRSSHRAR